MIKMGSGTFPITRIVRKDGSEHVPDDYTFLKKLADDIENFIKELKEDVYDGGSGGGQFDNAASDGACLEDLWIASRLIRKCFGTGENDENGNYTFKRGE